MTNILFSSWPITLRLLNISFNLKVFFYISVCLAVVAIDGPFERKTGQMIYKYLKPSFYVQINAIDVFFMILRSREWFSSGGTDVLQWMCLCWSNRPEAFSMRAAYVPMGLYTSLWEIYFMFPTTPPDIRVCIARSQPKHRSKTKIYQWRICLPATASRRAYLLPQRLSDASKTREGIFR